MGKYKKKIFIGLFVVFAFFSVIWSLNDDYEEPEKEVKEVVKTEKQQGKNNNKVFVDVKGEVNAPGVYELKDTNNVNDAINTAGGLTGNSDTSNINLSKKLSDEMVIIVYSKEDIRLMNEEKKIVCPEINNACVTPKDEKAKLEDNVDDNGLININTASKEELLNLNGVGESKAKSIIEYRDKNGLFESIEDIKNVSGIGDSLFEKIKDQITV